MKTLLSVICAAVTICGSSAQAASIKVKKDGDDFAKTYSFIKDGGAVVLNGLELSAKQLHSGSTKLNAWMLFVKFSSEPLRAAAVATDCAQSFSASSSLSIMSGDSRYEMTLYCTDTPR